jgi:hypothetical protein
MATIGAVAGEVSLHDSIRSVRVQTPTRLLAFPWESAQEFLARCIAAYPTEHPLVTQFKAVGVSRPVDLTDPADRAFALGVIEGWAAQVGEDELRLGSASLRTRSGRRLTDNKTDNRACRDTRHGRETA